MKFRNLHKFQNLENSKNVIFFYQLLEEMLFDYTLDTYKPSILNLHSLIEEAFEVINEIEKGNIKSPNIIHVLDELVTNLEKDKIANEMITISRKEINTILKDPKKRENHGVIKNTLAIVYNLVNQINYKKNIESEIIKLLHEKEERFKDVRNITRSYITFLIYKGYSPNYIRKEILDFFETGEKFSEIDNINRLFEIFNLKTHIYEVFFAADKTLSMCILESEKDDALLFEYKKENLPSKILQDRNFMKIGDNENFYSIKKEGIDPFSVRENTEKTISVLSNLINIFHHKKDIKWQNKFIILDSENNLVAVNKPVKSMHKCIDLPEKKAKFKLQDFLMSFQLRGESFSKFINSVRLHSIAIHTDSHENQLLNLWVSLESLIPADTKENDESNIEHIVDSVIPFLNMHYLRSLLDKLVKDLIRWNHHITKDILKNIDGDDFIIRLINLLSNDKYSDKFDDLIQKTKDFYLLNDRLSYFKELLSLKKKICSMIDNHTERLKWQIRRIYRARNIIVHTGYTPAYTSILIEHIHSYLDIILSTLIQLSTKEKIDSVGQGFQYIKLIYNHYSSFLGIKSKKNENRKIAKLESIENDKLENEEILKIFKYLN
ncbi:hypothetical protein P7M11_09610 [Bisgaard Taxon 10/6]|uniref:hypothetical protein n=1 Tax=Exercitatus varius TaxID=67857 RepID=UPI00294AD4B5|nr:hypothetical protein [Exercitatus varius]MDG2954968.1 hypothetical protein [Exercitatus varius]